MKKKTQKFEIKRTPISLNKYLNFHWSERKKEKDSWVKEIAVIWMQAKKPRFLPGVIVNITYCFPDNKPRDFDNFMPKFILDSLKETYLEDDNANEWIKTLNLKMKFKQPERKTIVEIIQVSS